MEHTISRYDELLAESAHLLKNVHFEGPIYRTTAFWSFLPIFDKPVKFLEIGTYLGGNAISLALLNHQAEIHCIDPWEESTTYDEYRGKQSTNYQTFLKNIVNSHRSHQFHVHRGFSHTQVPLLPDASFDAIYIDGNHEPRYVLEDAVLSWRKLKAGGILIFDDIDWKDTSIGIKAFMDIYCPETLACQNFQLFVIKPIE